MQQFGTIACEIRDQLRQYRSRKEINLTQITEGLYKVGIPDWLQSQILQMVNFNKYQRITCPIELAMEQAVHRNIIDNITNHDTSAIHRQ